MTEMNEEIAIQSQTEVLEKPEPPKETQPQQAPQPEHPKTPEPAPVGESEEKDPAAPAPARRQNVDMEALYHNAKPFEMWPDVVSNLRHYSRAISAAFEDTAAYVSGDYLLIETNHEIAFELLKKSAQREEIRKAVQEITGKVYKLGPYKLPEKKVDKDDVLDNFISKLKASGVNVTEE